MRDKKDWKETDFKIVKRSTFSDLNYLVKVTINKLLNNCKNLVTSKYYN